MPNKIQCDLGESLILRNAAIEDTEELANFNGRVHSESATGEPDEFASAWVRDLMTRPHPTLKPSDFLVVVDTQNNKIVSSLNYIGQTWSYDGIPFEVGRPELVGTDPEYRRKGLVRKQFEVIHQWGLERGHKMQGITGIPYYYRQFEYEMCLNLDGGRIGHASHVPKLKADEQEKYTFRPAVEADIPFIAQVYDQAIQRSLIACVRDETFWKYDIFGKSEKMTAAWRIIEAPDGEAVGFVLHSQTLHRNNIEMWGYELKAGVSYLDVTPSVIRYLDKTGRAIAKKDEKAEYAGYRFGLGGEHPVYDTMPGKMPQVNKPYAWYIRVPNLPDFLMHIAPVLEKRLAESPIVGYTGEFKIGFYRSGIKLTFEKGKLSGAENYKPVGVDEGDALFPNLTFLQLLVGYTSFAELSEALPDCYSNNPQGRALATFLFPKKASHVWMLG